MTNTVVSKLNDLLEYLHDSQAGYQESAQAIDNEPLRQLFNSFANQRKHMIHDLEAQVKQLGGKEETSGSVLGAAHRIFVDLKALITGGGIEAIVAEVKRGESLTISKYKEVLNEQPLSATIAALLQKQVVEIENNLNKVELLATVNA